MAVAILAIILVTFVDPIIAIPMAVCGWKRFDLRVAAITAAIAAVVAGSLVSMGQHFARPAEYHLLMFFIRFCVGLVWYFIIKFCVEQYQKNRPA